MDARGDRIVLMMTIPGLALFYCGRTARNILATMAQSFGGGPRLADLDGLRL